MNLNKSNYLKNYIERDIIIRAFGNILENFNKNIFFYLFFLSRIRGKLIIIK